MPIIVAARESNLPHSFKIFSSLRLCEREISIHPDMSAIECGSEWWLGIAVLIPRLQTFVGFAEGCRFLAGVPETCRSDEKACGNRVIEGLRREPASWNFVDPV